MGEVGSESRSREGKVQKSYFDVLGICCPSEVPLIEKILKPLDGIQKVSVVVPSKTVIVVHDTLLISQLQIVKALNQARLEASIRAYGTDKIIKKWPSPHILACGVLLLASMFQRFFRPLRWLAVAAVVVGLPPIVLRSIASIRRYNLDINILMLIAVGGAVALRDYSEAGFIVFLFTIAEWLESRASHKATAGMSALMNMAPQKAILAETGQVVDARDVKVNTILAVKAGEVIPIDGIVVEGRSEVNEQSLTGESFPVAKQAQSLVWAGTLNIDGYISVKTTALAEHSAVARMARLVEDAQNSRSRTQRLIDSCTKYYTPAVVLIAAGVAVIPLILRVHNPKHWFQLALVLLVSACPCALVLSTPVATFCALLKAARTGLLVKGGDVLEDLARTRVVAFDKTGTITKGEFTVTELRPIGSQEVTLHTLLYWISSIESKSSHPMASALVEYARSNSIEPETENVSEFYIYPGEGVCGEIDGKTIYIGNRRIATRAGCHTAPNTEGVKEAVTIGYVFSGAIPIGMFTLSDTCRTGAAEAIRELKSLGVKTAMLTGDSTAAAMHAQNQLGHTIEVLHAELLPEDKVQIVRDLKTKEGSTTMVGDGMNDAPALAAANVGISMGISGSAVAMETSHITLMSNDILKIPKAIRLARKTHRKIIGNILFSVITKITIVALAIAGHPLLWAAVLADVGTCLIVILNSMLLLRTRAPKAKKKCCRAQSHQHMVSVGCGAEICSSGACKEHVQRPVSVDCCAKGTCGSGKQATNANHEHVVLVGCGAENCGDGTHEEQAQRPMLVDCCAKGMCGSSKQATDASHEHAVLVRCGAENCGDSAHEEQAQRPMHVDCSVKGACGSYKCATNASHEHMVSAGCGAEHHSNGMHEEHVQRLVQADCCAKGACGSDKCMMDASHKHVVAVGCGEEDSGNGANKEHSSRIACRHGTDVGKECNNNAEKKEIGGCCKEERIECGKKEGCSSFSQGGMEKRQIGGCCKSYRKECGKTEGCCGGVVIQLPEIITE